jgi:hypothetical protein
MVCFASEEVEDMRARNTWLRAETALLGVVVMLLVPRALVADEGGAAMYLSGAGSLAAVPGEPGWSLVLVYDYVKGSYGISSIGYASERQDLAYAVTTYAFAAPVLGRSSVRSFRVQ